MLPRSRLQSRCARRFIPLWRFLIAVSIAIPFAFPPPTAAAPGEVDHSFSAPTSQCQALAVYSAGTSLVADTRLMRLVNSGAMDPLFTPSNSSPVSVYTAIAVWPDGQIVIGWNSQITRFRSDGSHIGPPLSVDGAGSSQPIHALVVLPDQSVLIGGEFVGVMNSPRPGVARLLPDGTLDPTFIPPAAGLVDMVHTLIPETDGRIVVSRTYIDSQVGSVREVARLFPDGTRDMSFNCILDAEVYAFALQPDGHFLIGGAFTQVNGITQAHLARLRPDGSLDPTFSPRLASSVESIALQADGRLTFYGTLVTPTGAKIGHHWLNPDGSVSPIFLARSALVKGLALQNDGKLLAAGLSTSRLIRIDNEPATTTVHRLADGRLHWIRGGTAAEVYDAVADVSTDRGTSYASPVAGTRIPGGWEFSGLSVTEPAQVRFRGRTVGGYRNGSSGLIEHVAAVGTAHAAARLFNSQGVEVSEGDMSDFANVSVGTANIYRFTLVNSGTADLVLSEVFFSGPDAQDFSVSSPVSGRLAPGHSSTFSVRFQPASVGEKTSLLRLIGPGPDVQELTARLIGRGLDAFASSNADLTDIRLGNGQLSPSFDPAHTTYTAVIPYHNDNLEIWPRTADSGAQASINGTPYKNNSISLPRVPMVVGTNDVTIAVTAADGTQKSYSLTLMRAAAPAPGGLERVFDLTYTTIGPSSPATHNIVPRSGRRVLLGGDYRVPAGTWPSGLYQLGPSGGPDPLFHRQADFFIRTIAVEKDGTFIAAATHLNSSAELSSQLRRFRSDGRADPTFSPQVNGVVHAIAFLPDDRILIAGSFVAVGGLSRHNIALLKPDGTLDPSFVSPEFEPADSAGVSTFVVEPDSKIAIGGSFTSVGALPRRGLARLHPDGSVDSTFDTYISSGSSVEACIRQPDGKLVVAGRFASLQEVSSSGTTTIVSRGNLARLNADGSIDDEFSPAALPSNRTVHSLALDVQGRLLLAGSFESVGAMTRDGIARVHPDGTVDVAFSPRVPSTVPAIALEADGSVLIAAPTFNDIAGVPHGGAVRLLNDPAIDLLTVDAGDVVTWTRGGSAPEVDHVIVEAAVAPGEAFLELGAATRTLTGWTFGGTPLPTGGQVRVRGRHQVGNSNGSVAWVESVAPVGRAPAPHVVMAQDNVALQDDQTVSFPIADGLPVSLQFSVLNAGESNFSSLTAVVDGPDASAFAIEGDWPAGLNSGVQLPLTVRFTPTGPGDMSARLTLRQENVVLFKLNFAASSRHSTDASLVRLRIVGWPISPAFTPLVAAYATEVVSSRDNVLVHPTATHPLARIFVNGRELVAPETQLPVDVQPGRNDVTVDVLAPDGVTSRQYSVTVQLRDPQPGEVDPSFEASFEHPIVRALPLPDGGCLVLENPPPPGESRIRLSRLLPDGSPHPGFQTQEFPGIDSQFLAMAALPDDGFLTTIPIRQTLPNPGFALARLKTDGSHDPTFASIDGTPLPKLEIQCLAVEPAGSIVIGGSFGSVFGIERPVIARLTAEGRLDRTFSPLLTSNNIDSTLKVTCLAIQADGKIIVAGTFTHVQGVSRPQLARLHPDGTLDQSFNSNPPLHLGPSIQFDSAGRILVARTAMSELGELVRLTEFGTADPIAFPLTDHTYDSLLPQVNGRILFGPESHFGSHRFGDGVARVDAEGRHDPSFKTDYTPLFDAHDVAAYPDGRLLLWGKIERVNDLPRRGLARLLNDQATESLQVPHTGKVRWERTGASPEAHYVSFALSTDGGTTFNDLGLAHRSNAGWEMTGLSLPPAGHIRARARLASGLHNRISTLFESVIAFTAQPSHLQKWRERHFGTTAEVGLARNDADPDDDGLPNLLEFASGLNPRQPDSPQPDSLGTHEPSGFSLFFQRSREAREDGFQWIVEWSDGLTAAPAWSSEGVELAVIGEFDDIQQLMARIPFSPGIQRFARLRVIAK